MQKPDEKILIVEDDKAQLETLAEILSPLGSILTAESGSEALDIIKQEQPAVVVADLVLPGNVDGLKILRFTGEATPETPVILITGHATVETALEAMKSGAYDYLMKPIDIRRLRALVQKALERYRLATEKKRLLEAIESDTVFMGMVGVSEGMRDVFRKISAVAPTDTTVLIIGESGTGKELVAEAIHKLSNRPGKLVKINCSAIPEHLLESELFGYEKGAFTGALRRKPGKFELANGGTLFLDEIGDMPPALQSKLLRVIETGEVEPLGATSAKKVDVRIIAATNQDLERLMKEGKFRQDLYFRLRVFVIEIPPLRKRREDIPILVSYFLRQISAKLGKKITSLSKDVMDAFMEYDWPGNVRQLRNALEEIAILAEGETINVLPTFIEKEAIKPSLEGKTMEEIEREAIALALKKTGGNRVKAAKMLGIGTRTLYRKIEKYGLEKEGKND
ncbi:sigma-54-dependent Fis family transcriptional regulator [bacterium]|nr:sigma-54-dependent Fis family transcriptional regulator [bacterium]